MNFDIHQIAATKSRWQHAGGLDYLLTRIRRELAERWAVENQSSGKVLLFDSDDSDLHLGDAITIQQTSALDSKTNFAANEFDGIIMCLQPAWLDLETVITETLRLLKPGGKLLFCTFGPDTLVELRWAWSQADDSPHVHPFIDMHHIGDQLLHCGFARPIMDVDRVTVKYPNPDTLYADLRHAGFTNILSTRRKTLTGKHRHANYRTSLDTLRENAEIAITYELIYAIATAPASIHTTTHASTIQVAPPKPKTQR